jgi:hypothetical protein
MSNHYIIPFWTVFGAIVMVTGVLIWLSVLKSKDNQRIEIGQKSTRWLMEQYLDRMLQRVVYHMVQYEKLTAKKGLDIRLSVAREHVQSHADVLSKNLLSFPRGIEVVESIHGQLKNPRFENTDLFSLPDVLVYRCGDSLYTDILQSSAKVVSNDHSLFEKYTNNESKQYLAALLSTTTGKNKNVSYAL